MELSVYIFFTSAVCCSQTPPLRAQCEETDPGKVECRLHLYCCSKGFFILEREYWVHLFFHRKGNCSCKVQLIFLPCKLTKNVINSHIPQAGNEKHRHSEFTHIRLIKDDVFYICLDLKDTHSALRES